MEKLTIIKEPTFSQRLYKSDQPAAPGCVEAVINLDWFECMAQGSLVEYGTPLDSYEYDGKRIILQLVKNGAAKNGTNFFKHKFEIFIDGKKFAYCLCETRNVALIEKDVIQLKLYNNILYEVAPMEKLNYFLEKMRWQMRNITRLDIALDGFGFINTFKRWQRGTYRKVGSCRSAQAHYGGKGLRVTGFDWGGGLRGKKWNKRITCYNKSDVLTVERKPYIGDFWKRSKLRREIICGGVDLNTPVAKEFLKKAGNDYADSFGADGLQKVERFELKLRNEEIKKVGLNYDLYDCFGAPVDKDSQEYKKMLKLNPALGFEGINWRDLDSFEYLAGIMKTSVQNYFEFVEESAFNLDKNISRCPRVKIVDWEKLGAVQMERCSTEVSSRIWSAKIGIKEDFFNYLSCKKDYYLIIAQEKALNINAMSWFMERQRKWRDQYAYMLKHFPEKFQHYANYRTTEAGEQLNLIEIPLKHDMYNHDAF